MDRPVAVKQIPDRFFGPFLNLTGVKRQALMVCGTEQFCFQYLCVRIQRWNEGAWHAALNALAESGNLVIL
jgi:hypothetical protein